MRTPILVVSCHFWRRNAKKLGFPPSPSSDHFEQVVLVETSGFAWVESFSASLLSSTQASVHVTFNHFNLRGGVPWLSDIQDGGQGPFGNRDPFLEQFREVVRCKYVSKIAQNSIKLVKEYVERCGRIPGKSFFKN